MAIVRYVIAWFLRALWPYGLIYALLWIVGMIGMGGWLLWHAMLALVPALTGFEDLWRLPFGLAVVALAVLALYTYRDPSPWRAIAIATFLGSAVGYLFPFGWPSTEDSNAVWLALMILALIGAAITVVSYADSDSEDRANSPMR
jgi:hypothetical protein